MQRDKAKRRATATTTTTLTNAAALQDHLMRSLDLRLPPRRLRQPKPSSATATAASSVVKDISSSVCDPMSEYRRVWVCDECTLENHDDVARCTACRAFKPVARRPRLTLAQKKGLVPGPPPRLNNNQWEDVEQQAEARGDAEYPCSICREPFGVHAKVLLSCSHMFHHTCLTSFERFLRTTDRVCPLCRKQNYEKKATQSGEAHFRSICARRLQARIRGWLARRRYTSLLAHYYKQGYGDPRRRSLFYASKVSAISSRIVRAMKARADSIDALLAEFDESMSRSRAIFNGENNQETAKGNAWPNALAKVLLLRCQKIFDRTRRPRRATRPSVPFASTP
ncbi:hypothetical protein, variant [Saprolegnia diclina VS20]|uniref:RanBP-type and C3HC4-type zinc finger-containing protein 1 n=1 Tax=Saprolegnia diclina (strain VS20) TaxID=1156394 RepID=T0R7Q2_SAPDV|nr:hypothetical protein, variant [Saprolegnia diclina VS20]EQC42470.1 hypothetical protein, variant [Saprolegnia diclina VS20]|eukprot:XP_008603893.1 hypothetical protein, variant [Saprolegnia diclina VS20]